MPCLCAVELLYIAATVVKFVRIRYSRTISADKIALILVKSAASGFCFSFLIASEGSSACEVKSFALFKRVERNIAGSITCEHNASFQTWRYWKKYIATPPPPPPPRLLWRMCVYFFTFNFFSVFNPIVGCLDWDERTESSISETTRHDTISETNRKYAHAYV